MSIQDRRIDYDFFRKPIFRSSDFRWETVLMAVSVAYGAFVLCWYWRAVPLAVRIPVITILIGIPIQWLQTIADHRKLSERIGQLPPDFPIALLARGRQVSMQLYIVALVGFFALAFTLHHYQDLFDHLRVSLRIGP